MEKTYHIFSTTTRRDVLTVLVDETVDGLIAKIERAIEETQDEVFMNWSTEIRDEYDEIRREAPFVLDWDRFRGWYNYLESDFELHEIPRVMETHFELRFQTYY